MEGISRPHIVTQSGTTKHATPLVRLPLERGYDEAWIQDLLDQAPDILPVEEIDDRVMLPLFSMGREISTPIGSIDNLFISQNSHVVLVETKLWRNPEARRSVVAQTLHYASHLRDWRYSDLDQLWRRTHPDKPSLWESLNPEGFTEAEWIDRVNYLLSQGQLTLLIVGDGIHSETEILAKAVGAQPDFHYRLGLVELRLFALASGDVLVLPMTVARTVEIERAVVRITYSQEPRPQVKVELPEPKQARRSVLSEEAFLAELASIPGTGQQCVQVASRILDLLGKSELTVEWRGSGFSVRMPDPTGSGVMLSLAFVEWRGKCGAYSPWLRNQLTRIWNNEETTEQIVKEQRQLFRHIGGIMTPAGLQVTVNLPQLAGREEEFVQGLVQLSEKILQLSDKIQAVSSDVQASL